MLMILADDIRCLVSTDLALEIREISCTTEATNATEVWSVIGTYAAALFAAIAAGVAAHVAWSERNRHRRQEVRDATSAFLQSVHTLAMQSKIPDRDNESDRNSMYQVSVLFELSAGKKLNQQRFNAAVNWILKAARLRHNEACRAMNEPGQFVVYHSFIADLVREMTECLRNFNSSAGNEDIAQDLSDRFAAVFSQDGYRNNVNIRKALTIHGNLYERLTSEYMPKLDSD